MASLPKLQHESDKLARPSGMLPNRSSSIERPWSPEPFFTDRNCGRRREYQSRPRSEHANRLLNMILAAIALVLLAPLMLLVALAVKVTSPGPVFYLQTRVGLDRRRRAFDWSRQLYDRRAQDLGGRVFRMYKFRSMRADAERGTGAVWASRRDPRTTPIGRVLRTCRLDELPQLFNVLAGDMNIVGPRPERPSIFATLRRDIHDYPVRQRAKPGITGWAQINQSYDSCIDDVRQKVRLDIEYLNTQSISVDLKIMLKTLPVMLFRIGGW